MLQRDWTTGPILSAPAEILALAPAESEMRVAKDGVTVARGGTMNDCL